MQARARIRYLRMSPKKMRRVATLIKGQPVEKAMSILNYTPKAAAHHLAKTLKSAAANAMSSVGTAKLKAEDLTVTRVTVDSAPTAKRVRFQSMGRVFRIRKRFCHVMVEVEGEPEEIAVRAARKKKGVAEKEEPTEAATDKKRPRKAKGKAEAKADNIDKQTGAVDTETGGNLSSATDDAQKSEEK